MTDKPDKLAADFLRPFSEQQKVMLLTLAIEADTFGLNMNDIVVILQKDFESRAHLTETALPPRKKAPPVLTCHECGSLLILRPVNISRCTNIGGNWKTSLECGNRACMYTSLSIKSVTELQR